MKLRWGMEIEELAARALVIAGGFVVLGMLVAGCGQ